MMHSKSYEEREFYLRMCQNNGYSKRELERQMGTKLFERQKVSDKKNKGFIAKSPGLTTLRDSYVLEFLDIPESHREADLRDAIVANLRDFIAVSLYIRISSIVHVCAFHSAPRLRRLASFTAQPRHSVPPLDIFVLLFRACSMD
jgi:hypothetical protein